LKAVVGWRVVPDIARNKFDATNNNRNKKKARDPSNSFVASVHYKHLFYITTTVTPPMSIQDYLPAPSHSNSTSSPQNTNSTLRHSSSNSSALVTPTKDRERDREREHEKERRLEARGSQHLQTGMVNANLTAGSAARLGSRSPNSIPSSPTSV
jgi:hypothetical protein